MTISLEERVARAIRPLCVISRRKDDSRDNEHFVIDETAPHSAVLAGPFSSWKAACNEACLMNARAAIAAVREREGEAERDQVPIDEWPNKDLAVKRTKADGTVDYPTIGDLARAHEELAKGRMARWPGYRDGTTWESIAPEQQAYWLDGVSDVDAQSGASIRESERAACEAIAREGSFPFDIDIWLKSTKKEMTALVALAIADALAARKGNGEGR